MKRRCSNKLHSRSCYWKEKGNESDLTVLVQWRIRISHQLHEKGHGFVREALAALWNIRDNSPEVGEDGWYLHHHTDMRVCLTICDALFNRESIRYVDQIRDPLSGQYLAANVGFRDQPNLPRPLLAGWTLSQMKVGNSRIHSRSSSSGKTISPDAARTCTSMYAFFPPWDA
jgi:hypothetical protein